MTESRQRILASARALDRHFDNKKDLLGELIRQALETFGSYLYRG